MCAGGRCGWGGRRAGQGIVRSRTLAVSCNDLQQNINHANVIVKTHRVQSPLDQSLTASLQSWSSATTCNAHEAVHCSRWRLSQTGQIICPSSPHTCMHRTAHSWSPSKGAVVKEKHERACACKSGQRENLHSALVRIRGVLAELLQRVCSHLLQQSAQTHSTADTRPHGLTPAVEKACTAALRASAHNLWHAISKPLSDTARWLSRTPRGVCCGHARASA